MKDDIESLNLDDLDIDDLDVEELERRLELVPICVVDVLCSANCGTNCNDCRCLNNKWGGTL